MRTISRRHLRYVATLAVFLAALVSSERASAEGGPAIGVGGLAAIAWGDVCRRMLSDVTGCTTGSGFLGVQLAPRWRLSPHWSAGAFGAVAWDGGNDSDSRTWWLAAAEGRFHPFGQGAVDPWLGADAGVVVVTDGLSAGELGPAQTYTQAAPAFGIGLGTDFLLGRAVTIGGELRSYAFTFGAGGASLNAASFARAPSYSTQSSIWLAVTVTVLLSRL